MAGLLGSTPNQQAAAPQAAQGAGADTLDDPVLQQIERGVEESVPPEYQQMYQSIVLSGMKVMFSKDTADLMEQQLDASDDLAANVSDGVAKLILIVFNESGAPLEQFAPAAALASISLMCQALDFAEQTRGVQVTPELAADCTKQTTAKVMQGFGISQDQVNQVMAAGQQQGGAQPAAAQPLMEA